MKKKILIGLIAVTSVLTLNAQTQVPQNSASPIWYNNGNVGIGTSIPSAGLQVGNFYNSNGNKVVALFGTDYDHWTYFGGLNAGRIRGSNEGYLVLESNSAGFSDKRLYLNPISPEDISIANGGGMSALAQLILLTSLIYMESSLLIMMVLLSGEVAEIMAD